MTRIQRLAAIILLHITILSPRMAASSDDLRSPDNPTEPGSVSAELSKGLDIDGWGGRFTLDRLLEGGGRLSVSERVNVWLHRAPGYCRQWKVDQLLKFDLSRPLLQPTSLSWLVSGEVRQFYDQRIRGLAEGPTAGVMFPSTSQEMALPGLESVRRQHEIGSWHLGFGGCYADERGFNVRGSVGPAFEERHGERQSGVRADLDLASDWSEGGFSSGGWWNRLPIGSDYGWSLNLDGEHSFAGEGYDRFSALLSQADQREYVISGEAPGRRSDRHLLLCNRLSGSVSAPLTLAWDSELRQQRTAHTGSAEDYTDRELVWKNSLEFGWQTGPFCGVASGGIDLQEQQYDFALNQGRRSHLGMTTSLADALCDSLFLQARLIGYRYDTPDEKDLNDRDELRYLVEIGAAQKLTPTLGFKLAVGADLRHLVYLFRPRSAENRWSRVFSLICQVPWQEGPIDNRARFAVVSNYTDYDFSPADAELSRVYRSFSAGDTLRLLLGRSLTLELDLVLLIDDHGRLRWDRWVEDLSEDGYGVTAAMVPTWNLSRYSVGLGWCWYRRETRMHRPSGETSSAQSIRSDGPVASISPAADSRFRWELYGSWLRVSDRLRGSYQLPDIRFQLAWTL